MVDAKLLEKLGSLQHRPLMGLQCRGLRPLHSKPSRSSKTESLSRRANWFGDIYFWAFFRGGIFQGGECPRRRFDWWLLVL